MKIGIIGLECAGKKTLFRILSAEGKNMVKKGSVEFSNTAVADPRVAFLSGLFNPKKTTYAHLEFVLTPSITGDPKNDNQILGLLHNVDGLILLVRAFDLEGLSKSDPEKDFRTIRDDLVFNDLVKVESISEKALKRHLKMKDPAAEKELQVLEKCKKVLEEGKPLTALELNEQEKVLVRNFDFLSRKPLYVLVNVPEDQAANPPARNLGDAISESLSLGIEEEIFKLEPAEQKEFLESLSLKEPGLNRILRDCYRMMELISFFTTGEDEVKAWTIRSGTTAKTAAGTIHSDIEKGFIRAEIIGYDDFAKAGGEKEAKKLNLFRLEGKEYQMKDGDIVHFRFNV
jgi:GTP-binding protein YchF